MKMKKAFDKGRWIHRLKVFLVIVGILLVLGLGAASLRVKNVTVEGNTHYTDAEIENMLFTDSWSRNPLVFLFRDRFGEKTVMPFIEKYTVTMTGIRSLDIIVYEKDIVAYVKKGSSYFYFDEDGYVVDSTDSALDGIPAITGLEPDHIVLGQNLPEEDAETFQVIRNISQFLRDTTITWKYQETLLVDMLQSIDIDEDGDVTCDFGSIKVVLGDKDYMEEKLLEMSSILPELSGQSGTLHLDNYDPTVEHPSYIFK